MIIQVDFKNKKVLSVKGKEYRQAFIDSSEDALDYLISSTSYDKSSKVHLTTAQEYIARYFDLTKGE